MPADEDNSSNLRKLRSRPVCIICGRPAEALEIAKALGITENRLLGHEVQKVKDGHTFYLGEFGLPRGDKLKYYVTSSLRQGIQSFTINAALLFSILNPLFVVHAGVCAGYDDPIKLRLQLRDVIFGEAAINYEEGKFEEVHGEIVFRPDYNRVSVEAGDMQAFAESKDKPNFHYGEYISGSAVRSDAGVVFDKIRSSVNRNAIALDMEASAFLQLCEHFAPRGPTCLGIVKGVSDFGNSDKGKDEDAYSDALQNTAIALKAWITHRIPAITWEADESDEPGARLVPGYYDNFVRRVLDNHSERLSAKYKDKPEVTIPADMIKGFKSVLPKAREPWFVKELGQVQDTMRKYGVAEIHIGKESSGRTLWYKAGYFIDWCRTTNSLESSDDPVHQVGVFERALKKQPYYKGARGSEPFAKVVSWEETIEWLEEVVKKERAGQEADVRDTGRPADREPAPNVKRDEEHEDQRKAKTEPVSLKRMRSLTRLFRFRRDGHATQPPPPVPRQKTAASA